jgi:hypothetical protein
MLAFFCPFYKNSYKQKLQQHPTTKFKTRTIFDYAFLHNPSFSILFSTCICIKNPSVRFILQNKKAKLITPSYISKYNFFL